MPASHRGRIAVAAAVGAGRGLASALAGAGGTAEFTPALNPPTPAAADPAPLPAEASGGAVGQHLSPATTAVARAVAPVLPGEAIRAVFAYRTTRASDDRLDARRPDGSGYEVSVFRHFAPYELADAGVRPAAVPGGTAWSTSAEPDIQSIYFLSDAGTAVRVAHHSARAGDHVAPDALRELARAIAARLAAAAPAALILVRPGERA